MTCVVVQHEAQSVRIPVWVTNLGSFRRWAQSDEFPNRGWFAYLNGDLWVDPNMERLAHNLVKGEISTVVGSLIKQFEMGRFLSDRMSLTSVDADLSTEPDGMFVSQESIRSKAIRFARGEDSVEAVGVPDMVLEVVSPSSRQKDTVVLRDLYWRAGIKEYWLADPRRDGVYFDILRLTSKGYVAVRKQGGWLKSSVFGKSFRLTRQDDTPDCPSFTLTVR